MFLRTARSKASTGSRASTGGGGGMGVGEGTVGGGTAGGGEVGVGVGVDTKAHASPRLRGTRDVTLLPGDGLSLPSHMYYPLALSSPPLFTPHIVTHI